MLLFNNIGKIYFEIQLVHKKQVVFICCGVVRWSMEFQKKKTPMSELFTTTGIPNFKLFHSCNADKGFFFNFLAEFYCISFIWQWQQQQQNSVCPCDMI